ncbi:hypothetical protein A9Q99_23535 [Gammaproteobacteria bacterium 45_16_T64]|nr:hypothetical protein A9Q99_23535 [Gammaproteobacteria bacterium 45_16_T64]
MNDMEGQKPWGMEVNSFCMLMHLSQLASLVLPGLGLILPLVMWLTNKELSSVVDRHGRVIANWMISALIYSVISGALVFIFVGVIGLFAIGACNVFFAIIGAVKASNGESWDYPLSIGFFGKNNISGDQSL